MFDKHLLFTLFSKLGSVLLFSNTRANILAAVSNTKDVNTSCEMRQILYLNKIF